MGPRHTCIGVGKKFRFDIPGSGEALGEHCGKNEGKRQCFNATGSDAFFFDSRNQIIFETM